MIEKVFTPKRTVCKVTFKVPQDWASDEVSLVGDFNNWDPEANKLEFKKDTWQTTVRLKPQTQTKFRYFIDGGKWANDDKADGYVPNEFGTEDYVLIIGKYWYYFK